MVLAFRGVYPLLLFDCETVVTLAVSVELSDVPAVTASETAEMLAGREHRARGGLCRDGSLNSWRVGSARTVSRDSIKCRLVAKPGVGRPRRTFAEAEK